METTLAHPAMPPRGAVSACQAASTLNLALAPDWAADVDLVYLSTRYYLDPAVASLPDADTELLFVRGIAYAGSEDTGGFIPEAIVPSLIRRRRYASAVEALVARSLWLPASGDRGEPGYRIARWQEWQEELEALERRRASDRERKRKERARLAADSADPPRKRGRPRKNPQVKNVSRDVSAISSADSPNITRSRSKDLDPDFDFDNDQVNQSASNAPAREADIEPGTPEFRLRVIAEFAAEVKVDIDDATADALAAEVLGKAVDPVPNPLGYVLAAIRNERKPFRRWLRDRPPPPGRTTFADPVPHCGDKLCSPKTRRREHPETGADDGPCPKCSPVIRRVS